MTGRPLERKHLDKPVYLEAYLSTQGQNAGIFYTAGHYDFADADANLTQAAATVNHGVANEPHSGHIGIVMGGAGTASGGAGAVILEVSGTSISDETGARVESDTEIVVSDITAVALNEYYETAKKFIGTVTITLKNADGSTQTTFAADFNYGHCKYTDLDDSDFDLVSFQADGLPKANDAGFDVRLLKHSAAGWTYAETGFVAGNGEVCSLATDYGTESDLAAGESFAYKRKNLNTAIQGSGSEGYVIEVTTGANNSIEFMTCRVGAKYL